MHFFVMTVGAEDLVLTRAGQVKLQPGASKFAVFGQVLQEVTEAWRASFGLTEAAHPAVLFWHLDEDAASTDHAPSAHTRIAARGVRRHGHP